MQLMMYKNKGGVSATSSSVREYVPSPASMEEGLGFGVMMGESGERRSSLGLGQQVSW